MVRVSVGENNLLDVRRFELELEKVHERRVIIARIHYRQIVPQYHVNVGGKGLDAVEEKEFLKKWSCDIEDRRERLPAWVLGLPLLLDFAYIAHIHHLKVILHRNQPKNTKSPSPGKKGSGEGDRKQPGCLLRRRPLPHGGNRG
jgi:hypothetical protein